MLVLTNRPVSAHKMSPATERRDGADHRPGHPSGQRSTRRRARRRVYTLQEAANAVFKVNGLTVTRSQNSGLTDVITGVTLNLAADAEAGKKATLTVNTDWSAARSAVDSFITKFNEVQTFIALKSSVESTTISGVTTYTRGTLADDNAFGDLRACSTPTCRDVSSGTLRTCARSA
jgi:flagellar capping protein FliD